MTAGGRRADRRHIRRIWWPLPSSPPFFLLAISTSVSFRLWLSPTGDCQFLVAVATKARTQLGVFQNKFPLQLLLITVIIIIIWGLSRPVWGLRGWSDNEAASARGEDHSEHRPATNTEHSNLKAFIKIIYYSKQAMRQPPGCQSFIRCLKTYISLYESNSCYTRAFLPAPGWTQEQLKSSHKLGDSKQRQRHL